MNLERFDERDDEATWRDVELPSIVQAKQDTEDFLCGRTNGMPLRESPSYVYAGDSETEEIVYLLGPAGELNPSDELVQAVRRVVSSMAHTCQEKAHLVLADAETDLENALERYRGRQ